MNRSSPACAIRPICCSQRPVVIPADSLVVVFGGGNDIRDAAVRAGQAFAQTLAHDRERSGPGPVAAQLAAQETLGSSLLNFAGIITDLVNAGARNLLVANAPTWA